MTASAERQIITYLDPKSPIAEAYRTLRTNLHFSTLDKPLRSLLVTSSGPGEGKSTTIANLAVAMAQAGSRVLLVDADLRKPVQHKIFEVNNLQGLTNVLVENADLAQTIKTTMVEGVDLLPSGPIPPNPSELLGSEKMKDFVQGAVNQYDVVLFDTPPVIAVTDAVVLSPLVDGVILVARARIARKDMLKEAKELLENANAKIIGTLLNGSQVQGEDYHYYYYYGERKKAPKARRKILGLF